MTITVHWSSGDFLLDSNCGFLGEKVSVLFIQPHIDGDELKAVQDISTLLGLGYLKEVYFFPAQPSLSLP